MTAADKLNTSMEAGEIASDDHILDHLKQVVGKTAGALQGVGRWHIKKLKEMQSLPSHLKSMSPEVCVFSGKLLCNCIPGLLIALLVVRRARVRVGAREMAGDTDSAAERLVVLPEHRQVHDGRHIPGPRGGVRL